MNEPTQGGPSEVDGDAHHKIVNGFRDPNDAWRTMAWLDQHDEHIKWAIHNTRFEGRAKRNAPLLRFAEEYAQYTRAVDGRGSQQAAHVAAMRVAASEGAFEKLIGRELDGQAGAKPAENPGGLPATKKKFWG